MIENALMCRSDCPFFSAYLEEVSGKEEDDARFICLLASRAAAVTLDPHSYEERWYYIWLNSFEVFNTQRECVAPDQKDTGFTSTFILN